MLRLYIFFTGNLTGLFRKAEELFEKAQALFGKTP